MLAILTNADTNSMMKSVKRVLLYKHPELFSLIRCERTRIADAACLLSSINFSAPNSLLFSGELISVDDHHQRNAKDRKEYDPERN
jgi:hypothetical protein